MRILVISELFPYPPQSDGARLKTYNLLKYLSEANEIRLISFYESEEQRGLLGEISQFCESIKLIKKDTYTVSKRCINILKRYPYSSKVYYSAALHKEIEDILSRGDVDIAHFDSTYMAQYFPKSSVPSIIVPHDCVSLQLSQRYQMEKNLFRRAREWYFYKRSQNLEKDYFGKFDKCIVVAEADKKAIRTILPQLDCIVIPNGVDFHHFNYGYENEKKDMNMIFTGNMNVLPNSDAALYFAREIFPLVRNKIKDAYFHIVGRNPVPEILKLSDEDDHIIVTGEVEDMREYLRKALVYVCPMRFGSGIKNKLLEAMAYGVPIVASGMAVKGSLDVVNGKDVFMSDKPFDFAEKVIALLNDKNMRLKFSENARTVIVEKYSWENVIKQYIKCYEDVICHHKTENILDQ
jgi:glycosyltransferase involved in cell wall biosynthesis